MRCTRETEPRGSCTPHRAPSCYLSMGKCRSFCTVPQPALVVPGGFHRSVTFVKLSARDSVEQSGDCPEPEKEWCPELLTPGLRETGSSSTSLCAEAETALQREETKAAQKRKTLVLDLDETLIRAVGSQHPAADAAKTGDCVSTNFISFLDQGGDAIEVEFYVRPYTQAFLERMAEHYEIIVTPAITHCVRCSQRA